ncbi:hypothetical protein SRHO_G00161330 [Serrasalmus rhombeus]
MSVEKLTYQPRLAHAHKKIVLFGGQVPYFNPQSKPRVHVVRVARTTVLDSGCEYILPGYAHFREHIQGEVMLNPTRGFVEKHGLLVARVVVDAKPNEHVPIRLFNPGTTPVKVNKGAIAGFLQAADVVQLPPSVPPAEPFQTCPNFPVIPPHLQPLYRDSASVLAANDRRDLAQLLSTYADVFSTGPADLGRTSLVQHDIQILPGPPVKQQPRRMAFEKQIESDTQIQQSLESGLASPSNSSWASPIVLVRKKDQTYRLCVDYRALNARTVKDAYPLPRIQDTLETLSTAKWFSTLDLASGYWQVALTPRARKAVAFCSRKGLFTWNVMPFGLCNAPATFQRLMDRVLSGLQWETCLVYLDDIILLGKDVPEMLQRLSQVLNQFRQANLKLKPAKCCLFRRQVSYLGHIVSAQGIATDPGKVQKVQQWPQPTSVSEVRQFVGLAAYYRRFVQDFATIAKPLHELTKKNVSFQWTPECQASFEQLKSSLTTTPVLGYPRDHGDLILDTDASNFGIGAVLSQVQDGAERVLAYGSRRLSPTEQNYCTTRRELLAVVEFTRHFRQYLLGRPFIVRSDHSSLRWLVNIKEPEGQLARWLEKLAEYDFQVVHRPGRHHQNADVMSRRPCRQTCPCNMTDPADVTPKVHHRAVQCDPEPLITQNNGTTTPLGLSIVGVEEQLRPGVRMVETVYQVEQDQTTTLFKGWSLEDLRAAQKADPDIGPVWSWLDEGSERPTWVDVSPLGPATKAYWSQWKCLYMRDGILLRRFYTNNETEFHPQIILPRVFRQDVQQQMHDGPVGGHFGVERMLARVQTRYYWYQMREDIHLWCRTCASCA